MSTASERIAGVAEPLAEARRRAVAAPAELLVDGLCKTYPGSTGEVLKDINLRLGAAERVALIGANGSGKSTLMRCCLHLVPPTAGKVWLFGTDLTGSRPAALRRLRANTGFVFQRHNLVPRLSVLSNVMHGARMRVRGPSVWLHGLAPAGIREEALDCLNQVGLARLAARRADRLSGGESQRVAIARALMQRPRLVFADEPVASLDPTAGTAVMDLFTGLMSEQGVGLLFTSHDLEHARVYADRVIGLKQGRLVFDRRADSVDFSALHTFYR